MDEKDREKAAQRRRKRAEAAFAKRHGRRPADEREAFERQRMAERRALNAERRAA
jgi:hypothetical protein